MMLNVYKIGTDELEKQTWAFIGAATAVALPLIFNTIKDFIVGIIKIRRERKYISVQLIFLLDKFTAECETLIWSEHNYNSRGDGYTTGYKKPEINFGLIKGEYKYLDANLLYRLHSIELKHIQILHELQDESLFEDPPEFTAYFSKRQRLYGTLGLFTAALTKDICLKLKIKHDSWDNGFNPSDSIKARLGEMQANRSRAKIRQMERKASRIMGGK